MLINTTRFGNIEIQEEEILKFPFGLPGFPAEKAFVFLPYQPDSPFAFLQSVNDGELAFLMVDPFIFFKDYQVEIKDNDASTLELSDENPGMAWCIVTVPEKFEEITANLLAPVIFNWSKKLGAQIVLEKTNYSTKHRVFPEGIKKQETGDAKGSPNRVSAEPAVAGEVR